MQLASEGGTNKVVEGSVSIVFLKDPTDPKWKNDAAMKLYRAIMKRYAPGANVNDVYHVYGMAAAWTAVEAIRKAGQGPHARRPRQGGRQHELHRQPVPAARDRAQDRPGRPLPDRADGRSSAGTRGRWKSFGGIWGYRTA